MDARIKTPPGDAGRSKSAVDGRGEMEPISEHGRGLLRLALSGRRLAARVEACVRRHDLTLSQLAVLDRVAANAAPVCNAEIAHQTAISQGALSVVVDSLIRRGLLRTSRNIADGRKKMLALTGEGEQILRKALTDCLSGIEGARGKQIAQDLALAHLVGRVAGA